MILHILQTCNQQGKVIEELFQDLLKDIPFWTILIWIPQLIQGYLYKNIDVFKQFLDKLCLHFPQYMFYIYRGFQKEFEEEPNEKLKAMFFELKQQRCYLTQKIENVVDTIAVTIDRSITNTDSFEQPLYEINKLIEQFYEVQNSKSLQEMKQKVTEKLQQQIKYPYYKSAFAFDQKFYDDLFQVSNCPLSQLAFIRQHIAIKIKNRFTEFHSADLLRISQNLGEVEILGQYNTEPKQFISKDSKTDKRVTISYIEKTIEYQYENRKLIRFVTFIGSNCKKYTYKININHNYSQKQYIQQLYTQQMIDILNIKFSLFRETAIRHLNIKTPNHYQLNINLSLVPQQKSLTTLLTLLDQHLQVTLGHKDPHIALSAPEYSWENAEKPNLTPVISNKMKNIVPEYLLTQYMQESCNQNEEFLALRKEIAYNFSCSSFLNFLLNHESQLQDYYIDVTNGNFFCENVDLQRIENELVNDFSVRLSRNISYFLTDVNIKGAVASSFLAMGMALTRPSSTFKQYLHLLLNEFGEQREEQETFQKVEIIIKKLVSVFFENSDNFDFTTTPLSTKIYFYLDAFEIRGQSEVVPLYLKYWF